MPESVALRLEEVSQEALEERISLRKVSAAVEMYDQLLQSGEVACKKGYVSLKKKKKHHRCAASFLVNIAPSRHSSLHGDNPQVVGPHLSVL